MTAEVAMPGCSSQAVDLAVPVPTDQMEGIGPEIGELGDDFMKSKGAN